MMWWWGPFNGWWAGFGVLLMVVFWGAVIALIIWAIRRLGSSSTSGSHQSSPLDIAKARYAKGEISKEQFEQLKKDLS